MEIDNEIESRLEKPLVSIIIPAYNAADTICRAVDSALSQEYERIEVIVVDDKSTDNTVELLREYGNRIKLICHEVNKNGAAARNSGLAKACGEYVAFLDSDDKFLPEKISTQIEAFSEISSISNRTVCIFCDHLGISSQPDRKFEEVKVENVLRRDVAVNSSALLVKCDVAKAIGGFDESFKRHQDLEFLVRLCKVGSVFHVHERLFERIFSGSPSFASVASGVKSFWDKFRDDIYLLSPEERRHVYALGYRRLAELSFAEKQIFKFFIYTLKVLCLKPSLVLGKLSYYLKRLSV